MTLRPLAVAVLLPAATAFASGPGHVAVVGGSQPNPPRWPDSVHVFGPGQEAEIEAAVNKAFVKNGGHWPIDHGQFSDQRFAFLFKPGTYSVDVPVGYYTQVLGLGNHPRDVVFTSARGVYSEEGDQSDLGGALNSFWRGAENFLRQGDMLWAVSQASPLRRLVIAGALQLAQLVVKIGVGYASGGYLGNSQVHGQVLSMSQQQWCMRNTDVGGWPDSNWNMVFIGSGGAPQSHCGRDGSSGPLTNVPRTPVIAEKPFISIDKSDRFQLNIPAVRHNRTGYDFSIGRSVDFDSVYVARDSDSAAAINARLHDGLDVVLSPGIYQLDEPLQLNHNNQVLLGLGYATLVAGRGNAAIHVGNVDGVRVAGLLLQAGAVSSDVLLQWGDRSYPGDGGNPGFLHDIFVRVGGPNDPGIQEARAKVMLRVDSGHVVGDNLWLWRADHGVAGVVREGHNPCDHALVVTGNHVTMYGLAAEHTLHDLVQWSGEAGETYFFQAELPYDATQAFGDAGYVAYRVTDQVLSHRAFGVGVYHYFRDHQVLLRCGIAAPAWLESSFVCPMAAYLTGQGILQHVINDKGGETAKSAAQVVWLHKEVLRAEKTPQLSASRWPTTPQATSNPKTTAATRIPADRSDCIEGWGKCGGDGWEGSTCCVSGFACVEQNIWYSLCIPEQSAPLPSKETPTLPGQLRSSSTSPAVLLTLDMTTRGAVSSTAWDKMLMGRDPPPQRHSHFQEKQRPTPRTEASFSIPWWAWLSLAMQTSAIFGLGIFLWHLSAIARQCLNGENQVEPQPVEDAIGTPRVEGNSSRLILVHRGPPTMTIQPLAAYSPETTRSMRSLMVTSPISEASPDEA